MTDQLKDGMLTLPEVYEDQLLVETEDDKKDDKRRDSTGGGEQEDKTCDTKTHDKKSHRYKKYRISGSSNNSDKRISTGNSQEQRRGPDRHDEWNGSGEDGRYAKNVMYFMAIVSGAVL